MKKKQRPVYKYNYNYANGGEFGDFLQSNASGIGTVVGAGIGALVLPGVGAAPGAAIGGALGGVVQGNYQQNEQNDQMTAQINEQNRMRASANFNNRIQTAPQYGANFANGGGLSTTPPDATKQVASWQIQQQRLGNMYGRDPRVKKVNGTYILYQPANSVPQSFSKISTDDLFAPPEGYIPAPQDTTQIRGTKVEMLPFQQDSLRNTKTQVPLGNGGNIKNMVSEIKSGTTHENSVTGGVKIGNNALVEDKEFIYTNRKGNKFVFTNRF